MNKLCSDINILILSYLIEPTKNDKKENLILSNDVFLLRLTSKYWKKTIL